MAKFGQYYIDGDNLGNATAVFSNEKMTTLAPEGYYSEGNITRYFNTTGKGPELIKNGNFNLGINSWATIPLGNGNFTPGQVVITTGGAPGQTKLFNIPGQETLNLFPTGQVEFYFEYAVSATTGNPTLQYFDGTNFINTDTSASEEILFTSTNTINDFQINIASSTATDTITITNLSFRQKIPIGLSGNLDCPLCTVDCAVQPLITTPNNAAGIANINTKFGSATGAIKVTVNTSKPIGLFLKNQTSSNTYNEFVDANDGLNVTADPSAVSYYYGGGYTDTCTNWDNNVLSNPPVFEYNVNTGGFDFVGNNPTSSTSNKVSVGSDKFLSLVNYIPKAFVTDFVLEGEFAFPCGGDEDASNYANIQISCPSPLPSVNWLNLSFTSHADACSSNIGPELATNGSFGSASDWSDTGNWTINSGLAKHTASGNNLLYQNMGLVSGKSYQVQWVVDYNTSGTVGIYEGSYGTVTGDNHVSSAGTYNSVLLSTDPLFVFYSYGVCGIDSVSVKEIISSTPLNTGTMYIGRVSTSAGRNNIEINDLIYHTSSAEGGLSIGYYKVAGSDVGSAAVNSTVKVVDRVVTEIQDC